MILQTLEECIATEQLRLGVANYSVFMRKLIDLPFVAQSVVRTYLKEDHRDEVEAWCEASLSGNCRMEFSNAKIFFEYEDDALLFLLRWKGEDVSHSFM